MGEAIVVADDLPCLYRGYDWACEAEFEDGEIPQGATFSGQVRSDAASADVLAEMTISRVDDAHLELAIAGADSAGFPDRVVFDVVRSDSAPPEHLCFQVSLDVLQPITDPESL